MSSRRVIILLVAIAIGALSAVGLLFYVRGLETAQTEGQQLKTVWIVQDPIPKGTPAAQVLATGLIAQQEIPVDYFPATAIQDPTTELAGLVAVTDLPANTIVVAGQFVAPNVVATGVTDRLEERNMVTVSFTLDQVAGAAYMIEPGDFVNILAKFPIAADASGSADPAVAAATASPDTRTRPYTTDPRYLFQKAEVLAVDRNLTSDLGASVETNEDGSAAAAPLAANQGLITLAVPPEAVQRILGVGLENIYLSLVPSTYTPRVIPPLVLDEPRLPGENEAFLTPYLGVTIVEPTPESDTNQ